MAADITNQQLLEALTDQIAVIADNMVTKADLAAALVENNIELRQEIRDSELRIRSELASFRRDTTTRLDRVENELFAIHNDLDELYDSRVS